MDPDDADAQLSIRKIIQNRFLDRTGPKDTGSSRRREERDEAELALVGIEVLPDLIHHIRTLVDLLRKERGAKEGYAGKTRQKPMR